MNEVTEQVASVTPEVSRKPKVIFSKTMAGFLLMKNNTLYKVDRDKKDPKRSTFIYGQDERLDDSLAMYDVVEPIIKAVKYGDEVLIQELLKVVKDYNDAKPKI
jgi:hypothetical protein